MPLAPAKLPMQAPMIVPTMGIGINVPRIAPTNPPTIAPTMPIRLPPAFFAPALPATNSTTSARIASTSSTISDVSETYPSSQVAQAYTPVAPTMSHSPGNPSTLATRPAICTAMRMMYQSQSMGGGSMNEGGPS